VIEQLLCMTNRVVCLYYPWALGN